MEALLDATDSQMARLADLVSAVDAAETTISAMMAARDGLLALAERVAVDIAAQGDHPDRGDMTIRAVAAEIGQRLRVSDRTVERRMGQASCLVDAFPAVWQAQGAGRISSAHARVIVEAGAHLVDAAEREAYAAAVLPLAEAESANRLRPMAVRVAERFRERSVDERHRDARQRRRVWMTDEDDAMAGLHLHAPAVLVHAMFDRLSQMAHSVRSANRRGRRTSPMAAAAESPCPSAATADQVRTALAHAVTETSVDETPVDARSADETPIDARSVDETPIDARSVDELRADLLTELVLTGVPTAHETPYAGLSGIRGRVEVSVPVLTLLETECADDETECADDEAECADHGEPAHCHGEADQTVTRDSGGMGEKVGFAESGAGHRADTAVVEVGIRADTAAVEAMQADGPFRASRQHGCGTGRRLPPAMLDGATPIDTATARMLAGSVTGWDRVLTHPVTAAVLAVDRYRPAKSLRRHLRARDQRCRFPTCGLPARKSDLDHTEAAATGGATSEQNLSVLCRRHHMLKHHSPWHVARRRDGTLEWTSPLGRTYVDRAPTPHTVVFELAGTPPRSRAELLSSARAPF